MSFITNYIAPFINALRDKSTELFAKKNPYLYANVTKIKNAVKQQKLLLITVNRIKQDANVTLGRIYANNNRIGSTLELPWKDDLPDASRIKARKYSAFTRDIRFKFWKGWRLQLVGTEPRENIQVHPVAMFSDSVDISNTRGCIVVGDKISASGNSLDGNGSIVMEKIKELFGQLKEKHILVEIIERFPKMKASMNCVAADGRWPDNSFEPYIVRIVLRNIPPNTIVKTRWKADNSSIQPVDDSRKFSYSGTISLSVPGSGEQVQDRVTVQAGNQVILNQNIFDF
ncbi:MAG: hypothetical protein F6J87_20810 [Spirulina sp. SIO3F2]|nr:hypothetical protein [Spirulina sp. SIO3F2]